MVRIVDEWVVSFYDLHSAMDEGVKVQSPYRRDALEVRIIDYHQESFDEE
jgi:hypothetical protein